jgi:hypothetical protein
MPPQRHADLPAQASQALQPGVLGQRPAHLGREVLLPAASPPPCIRRATTKERGTHAAKDFPHPLLVASQAACELLDQVVGAAPGLQSLCERLNGSWGLWLSIPQTLVCSVPPSLSGFGLFCGVSCAGGPGTLLQTVVLAIHGEKETLSPQ